VSVGWMVAGRFPFARGFAMALVLQCLGLLHLLLGFGLLSASHGPGCWGWSMGFLALLRCPLGNSPGNLHPVGAPADEFGTESEPFGGG